MAESASVRLARDLHILSALTERVLEAGDGREAPSFTQIMVLKWLDSATPRRAQQVARYLGATAPAATQLLGRLRKKGLVKSRPNPEDRRAEDLMVTPRGRSMVARFDAMKLQRLERLLQDVPETRRRLIFRGIESAIGLLLADKPALQDLCLHCGAHQSAQCLMREHGMTCPTERVEE